MPDDTTQSEAKLQKLAQRLHRGWAKLHPATEKDLAAVRAVVRQQWEKDQKIEQRIAASKPAKDATRPQTKRQSKPAPNRPPGQDQDRGR